VSHVDGKCILLKSYIAKIHGLLHHGYIYNHAEKPRYAVIMTA